MTQNKSYDANTLFAAIAIIPFLVPNGLQTFSFDVLHIGVVVDICF